jgi:hypothetical protein
VLFCICRVSEVRREDNHEAYVPLVANTEQGGKEDEAKMMSIPTP